MITSDQSGDSVLDWVFPHLETHPVAKQVLLFMPGGGEQRLSYIMLRLAQF